MQETPSKWKDFTASERDLPTTIYSGITRNALDQIKNIDLDGYVELVSCPSIFEWSIRSIPWRNMGPIES